MHHLLPWGNVLMQVAPISGRSEVRVSFRAAPLQGFRALGHSSRVRYWYNRGKLVWTQKTFQIFERSHLLHIYSVRMQKLNKPAALINATVPSSSCNVQAVLERCGFNDFMIIWHPVWGAVELYCIMHFGY